VIYFPVAFKTVQKMLKIYSFIHSFIQLCTQLKDEAIGVEGINSLNMASGSCKTSKVGSDEDRANASASEALQQQYF
jgi:hypothetical protein